MALELVCHTGCYPIPVFSILLCTCYSCKAHLFSRNIWNHQEKIFHLLFMLVFVIPVWLCYSCHSCASCQDWFLLIPFLLLLASRSDVSFFPKMRLPFYSCVSRCHMCERLNVAQITSGKIKAEKLFQYFISLNCHIRE